MRRRPRRSADLLRRRFFGRRLQVLRRGTTWEPIFDDQPAQSIGALAVAASDPNVVWAGTGEAFVRSNISIGNGVYKSTDAGQTWKHMGLEKIGPDRPGGHRPARIPTSSSSPPWGTATARRRSGASIRTKDGGKTWEQVLFADENTGCFEIAMDLKNPADPVRRHVAARHPHLRPGERRPERRDLEIDRRRRHLEAAHRPRPARTAGRQGRPGHLLQQLAASSTP